MDRESNRAQKLDLILFSIVLIYCLVILAGFLSGYFRRGEYSNIDLNKNTTITGVINDEPQIKNYGTQFVLETDKKNNILVSTGNSNLTYGDQVKVQGILQLPENFQTDQGTTFDYVSYLYKDDILYQIKNASTTVISHNNKSSIIAYLISLKQKILHSYQRVLPGSEANFLGGLNLGEKQSIDNNFRNQLVTTGTIHIIALSGYNVTIVANAMRDFFVQILDFSAHNAYVFGALGIIFFVAMTGFQSSSVRAGIMALIAIFGRTQGRTYDAFRALVLAGFIMILWDPKYLVYDVSFQLSFLATLGLIFITPILEQKLVRVPQKIFWIIPIRELICVTLGAQIGVLPFILYKMGTLSLISLPANIFILPFIPYTMFAGALSGLIGMISVPFAYPLALITRLLLKYIISVIGFFANIPYASITISNFPLWLCLLCYGFLIWIVCKKFKN